MDIRHGFVEDGFERARDGVEAEIRPEIEQLYAEQFQSLGRLGRWLLRHQIERQITLLVDERTRQISSDSLF